MNILIDYLVLSIKINTYEELFDQLNMDIRDFIEIKSYYGATNCVYHDGIKVHYNVEVIDKGLGRDCESVNLVILDLSGKGCRSVESMNNSDFDWLGFLKKYDAMFRSGDAHIARLDIACDDTDGMLDMQKIYRYTLKRKFVCRAHKDPVVMMMGEESIYFGSKDSDRRLRIYNKALEKGILDQHWIRVEFQLRNDNAMSWYLNWLNYEGRIGELFAGVLLDFLRYVELSKDVDALDIKNNRHQARMKTARWWDKYLQTANRIPQLYLPGEEYDFSRLQRAAKQTHSTVKTLMLLNGGDWPEYINEVNKAKLNRHQRELVKRAGMDPNEKLPVLQLGAYTDEVDLPKDDPQTKWIRELLRKDRE